MSYDEVVQVHLNLEAIRWKRIDDMVQAIRIANGAMPPASYYKATGRSEEHMASDLLGSMMGRTHGR